MIHRLVVCVACLLAFAPQPASALGLGAIEARSALNAPLDARILLTRIRSGDLEGLKVALGSPAQFELAGVPRLQILELLEFSVVSQDDGRGQIHIRTDEPITEPSLTFLVEVDWPRGRTVRGYKLHLAPAVADVSGASTSGRAAPEAKREPGTGASVSPPASPPASGGATMTEQPGDPDRGAVSPASGGAVYGPVRASDTLWSIATLVRPDDSVSVQRMMLALLETNPEAFTIRNVNALKAGVTLRIPDRDELGPGDRRAFAELKRQHAAWMEHRESVRAAPASAAPAPAPSSPDAGPEPGGRIEVVSPETTVDAAGGKEEADIRALRNELALAVEEADAGRRENAELRLRLSEVEGHIKELIRLVALKSEEIAALQAELRAMAAGMQPKPESPEGEPKPESPEPKPESPEPKPESPEPKPASQEGEPKSLPFGLGALPVSPVYLVGGAGLLLLLLGVVALLRRRASSREDDTRDPADPPSPGEDGFLHELEAVAADLADETVDPQGRRSRSAPAAGHAGGMGSGAVMGGVVRTEPDVHLGPERSADVLAVEGGVVRSEPGSLADQRIEELWKDAPDTGPAFPAEPEADDARAPRMKFGLRPASSAAPEADDDKADISFDIDALVRHDSGSGAADDEADADFDAERRGDPTGPAGDPDLREARAVDPAAPASTTGAGGPAGLVHDVPEDLREDAPSATPAGEAPVETGSRVPGTARRDSGGKPAATADERVDPGPGPDGDYGGSTVAPRTVIDDPADHAGTRAFSVEDLGEDEVQTKIDLAQVYMEMGDTDNARGFLEAVLAEGDADQRDVAREMLAKLA